MERDHKHEVVLEKTTHDDEFGTRKVHYCFCGDYRVEATSIREDIHSYLSEWRTPNWNLED